MKRAAADISRSKFEVYNFATKHDLSETAIDELLQMLSNVGNMAIPFTILVVVFVMIMMMKSSSITVARSGHRDPKLELPAGQISTSDNPAEDNERHGQGCKTGSATSL